MRMLFGFTFVSLAALSLAGCGNRGGDSPSPEPPAIGDLSPEIEGIDLDGEKFKLSDFRGKVVVLDFWRYN